MKQLPNGFSDLSFTVETLAKIGAHQLPLAHVSDAIEDR